jgi:curli biogenesis system outer membrane secretion channel CsgG
MRSFKFFKIPRKLEALQKIALTLVICCLFGGQAEAKPRLAVRDFDNKAESGARVPASAINEMMTTELFNAGLFTILEREKLDYIAEEQKLGMSGLVDESTAPKVGNIKGARYTMTGAITVYHYHASGGFIAVPGIAGAGAAEKTAYVTLDIRIIDNETSEVIYSAAQQGEATREA